jgi:hypothetical protein
LSDVGSIAEEIKVPADIVLCSRSIAKGIVIEGVAALLEPVAESVVGVVKV